MTYIILFSSDFVELQDKRTVERIQHGYVKLLERHTYSQVRYVTTSWTENLLSSTLKILECHGIE